MTAPALVVSIHDVSPFTREAVTRILAGLAEAGIARTSLLVVPDHHHRGNITSDPAFRDWLRAQIGAGHESVLHGYYHQRERHAGESAQTRFITRLYTADEGEFFDIGAEPARALLTRGRDELTTVAGVAPTGFIAPAWLLSNEGEIEARDLGFRYTTRLKSIKELSGPARLFHSQSLCWSVRSGWRRAVSLTWNNFLFRRLTENPLLRISIHPPDIAHPLIWRQILALSRSAAQARRVLTYEQFLQP